MIRKIIHLDLDAFFCSVEELLDPSLIGKVFAVGGNPNGRGVITSASYAARQYGIHSAMPTDKRSNSTRIYCSFAVVLNIMASTQKVMAILHDTSPIVEQMSVDEAYLDVSDMPQPIASIAFDLQKGS